MEDLSKSQELKQAFFSKSESFFGKKPRQFKNKHLRDITSIFSSIADDQTYHEIRKRFKIHHAIKMGLSQTHLGFIVYVAYKNPVLTIMATNHVGQTELNYQKMALIKHLKQYKDFRDIAEVSILRYDRVLQKERLKNQDTLGAKKEVKKEPEVFDERSYGIFENNLTDDKLAKKVEQIRSVIQENKPT